MRNLLSCVFCVMLSGHVFAARESEFIPLWSAAADAESEAEDKDIPRLYPYPAAFVPSRAAVIICPGGGYGHLAIDHEGHQIARWFQQRGITAFVLRYRLPSDGYRHPVPLMDAQRAIRLVRSQAEEWKIDADKIGILGFSAGGHLASTAAVRFGDPVPTDKDRDAADAVSCRPDFAVLVYPVISMQDGVTHGGSRNNLLGPNPPQELVERLSNEKQVSADTPPTFLVHSGDDKAVSVENSLRFYQALRACGVRAEMHLFLKGGHGYGIRSTAGPAAEWIELCRQWMREMNFIAFTEQK